MFSCSVTPCSLCILCLYFLLMFVSQKRKICFGFQLKNSESESSGGASMVLHETPIRIITTGQELTTDSDEKTLGEAGFKDNQVRQITRKFIL